MIVTRTPLRISLGGGGTDLPFYCDRYGSSLIYATINKYIYITANGRVRKSIKLNYRDTEIVDTVDEVKHPLIREALKHTGIEDSIEIHSVAEVPSGTGLGSSASFLVGLLNALYYHKGEIVPRYRLAEDASHLLMNVLKEDCGKQDQYAAAFGNVSHLAITPKGRATVSPVNIDHGTLKKLSRNLQLFFTGVERSANEMLTHQKKKAKAPGKKDAKIIEHYHEIKRLGEESRKSLEEGDTLGFGKLMDDHWRLKRGITTKMSNKKIDSLYEKALGHGAVGGKIVGAGGGGFLMVYSEENHGKIAGLMADEGLEKTDFRFDYDGTRIVYDGLHF